MLIQNTKVPSQPSKFFLYRMWELYSLLIHRPLAFKSTEYSGCYMSSTLLLFHFLIAVNRNFGVRYFNFGILTLRDFVAETI